MKELVKNLAAGQQEFVAAVGNYIYLKQDEVVLNIITDSGDNINLGRGQGIELDKTFNGFYILNTSEEQQQFVIMVGFGKYQNNTMTGDIRGQLELTNIELLEIKLEQIRGILQQSSPVASDFKKIDFGLSSGSGVLTYQIPANADRKMLIVRNNNSATSTLWCRVNGWRLNGGEMLELNISGGVELYVSTAVNIDVWEITG
ncbi:MAG: hypothetical protein IBX50_13920 [Marinospirillum sp.]|uniref:hypothetical protein n=1 Tax=Marinospirillum sp. TaxID=2183934 RepID=UPI001A0B4C99|nr:hypothetical protein [Marinospirillum sp.]MBE0507784.1 hypothetical protein [Marinospirillum sp.]